MKKIPKSTGFRNKAPIFRYYRADNPPENTSSVRGVKRRSRGFTVPKLQLRKLPTYIAVFLVLGAIFTNFSVGQPVFRFGDKRAGLRSQEEYQSGVQKILRESIFSRNKLTFSSSKLEKKITDTYPEISAVSISLPLVGTQPVVGVQFDEPSFVVKARNGSYVIGKSGIALIEGVSEPSLGVVEDVSGLSYSVGERVMTPDDVLFIKSIFSELAAKGLMTDTLRIGTNPRDIILKILGDPYLIKMSFTNNAREQMGALWVIREQLEARGEKPSEYIDVRLAERVFIK